MTPVQAGFRHLDHLSDHRGVYRRAVGADPFPADGYCTEDNALLLVVSSREPDAGLPHRLGRRALTFVLGAQAFDGRIRRRMDSSGMFTDAEGTDDCWGLVLHALATAATSHGDASLRRWARRGFEHSVVQRSHWPRAMAYATLGASAMVTADPGHETARALLLDALALIGDIPAGERAWPEPQLTYANATLAEAVIAAGSALPDDVVLERGLAMLAWLLERQTRSGHLSFEDPDGEQTGNGRDAGQRPAEAAALADACWRAYVSTSNPAWSSGVLAAARWFTGDNDLGRQMIDPVSGGGYDALHPYGLDENQSAEATIALVSTMQRAATFTAG